ncbi:MAG: type II toxin-antitoxin system VapC family toxin [Burkholderiaceae bacterium]|nr:type II toxin-antitoxin system VapC family toxin [Burkholderiaceae bacterium]
MASLDTNILVRLLVQDDPRQTAAVQRLLAQSIQNAETLFVPVTVSLELEWVLRARYGFAKADIIHALSTLLRAVELSFESEPALEMALLYYEQSSSDYAYCLHVALAELAQAQPLWTFDKAAAKTPGARLLAA